MSIEHVKWNTATYINWTTDTGVELRIENAWDWLVFCDIWVNRCYPLFVNSIPKKSLTMVDIGANVGYFSLYALHEARKAGVPIKIYAFEANPLTSDVLTDRVAPYPEIETHFGAVGRLDGETCITLSDNHGTSFTTDTEKDYPHVVVKYRDLNEILPKGQIDCIKCDIEGSEFDFVQNYEAVLHRTRLVFMETHYTKGDAEALRAKMKEYGFTGNKMLVDHETACVEVFYR